MSIVCATDFSDPSRAAEDAAATLAARLGQPLWLVHVQAPDVELVNEAQRAAVKSYLEERLVARARELAATSKGVVQVSVESGRVVPALRALAQSKQARMIVVGSVGHGLQSQLRLGGTSERLANGSDVPVLVVREGESFGEWTRGTPLKVLLALDEDASAASAVRWVGKLRELGPVDVVLGRVYFAGDAHAHYGVSNRRFSYTNPDPGIESLIERDLKRAVPELPGKGELFYRAKLGVGAVSDHLLELAEAERCQVVVVGSHKRSGLARMWSTSAAVLHHSRMSVAIIPPDGADAGPLAPAPRFRRVLVTTDFSRVGNAALPWAYALADVGGEVFLAHVTPSGGVASELAELYTPALPMPHPSPRVEAELAARLRALVPESSQTRAVATRTEVVRGIDAAKAIVGLAEQLGVDAIVISSHGRSGVTRAVLGSVAEEVLRGSTRPVFIVRPPV